MSQAATQGADRTGKSRYRVILAKRAVAVFGRQC
jgi:hypothetical protein